jgi:hypothetical protein
MSQDDPSEDYGGRITISLQAIQEAIDRQRDSFLAALSDMRDPKLRGDGVDRALSAATQLLLVMQIRPLFYERVHGIAGPPVYPADAEPRRRMILEEMASIMGRLVRPAFGWDHIPSGALFDDCARWLGGHPGDTYGPIGHANPSTPDRVELDHRHVAVLLLKLIAAAKGVRERPLAEGIPGAPNYDAFLKWQSRVPATSRKRFQDWGKRANNQHGAGGASLPPIDLTLNESTAIASHPYEREALRLYTEDGELALAKLFAWIGRTGDYRERSGRHGKGGSH